MTKKIDVVSLFSGIGGFEEGLRLANIKNKVVFASEIDSFAQISYKSNFNGDFLYGDITKIDESTVPNHHLLVAGFPCQSFSIAGKRQGFEDIRGTLFFDVARILNKKKPKYVLLENVKNLISHDGSKTIRRILETLNNIGYVVDFTVINSYEAGVPQNRDRTYICGIYKGSPEKFLNDKRSSKVNKLKQELNETNFLGFNFFDKVEFSDEGRYIENILEDNVDSKFFLDTDNIKNFLKWNLKVADIENERKIIKLFDLPKEVHNDLDRQRRVYSIKGISPTVLARSDSAKVLVRTNGAFKIRKITPTENFRIQGFGENFVKNIKNTGMSNTQMYKQSGNAVSPPVIAGILKLLYKEYIVND